MSVFINVLRIHKQLFVLLFWVTFIGFSMWKHAQESLQPPLYDASTYYLKAYNFWSKIHQHKLFNPLNVEPSFRPPGTVLMSYPFGFDTDYRGFYFRSIFLPIVLLVLAVVVGGYRRELDSKCKWHLVLSAAFLSSLPCFYYFELTSDLAAPSYWGLVDNYLAGVAALATAATMRSVWTQSLAWLLVGAILSVFCLLIKPTGIFVMMLIGLVWFGLEAFKFWSEQQNIHERKNEMRRLLCGIIIFAVLYLIVLIGAFTSRYLSPQNLAFGKSAIAIMQTELPVGWSVLLSVIQMGVGYPFIGWLFLMILLVGHHFWTKTTGHLLWPKPLLVGWVIAAISTLTFGIWFWIFGSGGSTQIRYSIPFALMAAILILPVILVAIKEISNWKIAVISIFMAASVINIGLLLPQQNPEIEWQKWTGVNLTSGKSDPVIKQAQNFVSAVKQGGRDVSMFSMALTTVDANFQAVILNSNYAMPPMPSISILRPVDWQRPSTFRKEEMFIADYWLFEPVDNPSAVFARITNSLIENFDQETMLFQAWATQLTTNEGVSVVSDTPTARVLCIIDRTLLESAFDALVAKHNWRKTFVEANPKRRFSENELAEALAMTPPNLENVNFADRFHLRALSVSRIGDDTTVRVWWKPLSPLLELDWAFFIHSIDAKGKIVLNKNFPIRFKQSLAKLNGAVLFDQIAFKNPVANGTQRLAIGFNRPNQALPQADKGTRDWGNRRVIVPLPLHSGSKDQVKWAGQELNK